MITNTERNSRFPDWSRTRTRVSL